MPRHVFDAHPFRQLELSVVSKPERGGPGVVFRERDRFPALLRERARQLGNMFFDGRRSVVQGLFTVWARMHARGSRNDRL